MTSKNKICKNDVLDCHLFTRLNIVVHMSFSTIHSKGQTSGSQYTTKSYLKVYAETK